MRYFAKYASLLELYDALAIPKYIEMLVSTYVINKSSQVRRNMRVMSQYHNLDVRQVSYSDVWMLRGLVALNFCTHCLRCCEG